MQVRLQPRHLKALDDLVADLGKHTLKEHSRPEAMRFAFQEFCYIRGYMTRKAAPKDGGHPAPADATGPADEASAAPYREE